MPRPASAAPAGGPAAPPPPRASARFPDAPPVVGGPGTRRTPADGTGDGGRPGGAEDTAPVPPPPAHRAADRPAARPEAPSETTTRLRPVPGTGVPAPRPAASAGTRTDGDPRAHRAAPAGPPHGFPDPALSWSAPSAPGGTPPAGRPAVSFGQPEGYDGQARPRLLGRRPRSQVVAAAVCLVLGAGLIGGAATGSWLAGDSGETGTGGGFASAAALWHSVPVDELFPPTLEGKGAGPGGADRTWTRIAVAPDSGCKGAFDPLLRKVLGTVGCERLLRATYTDATQSHVTTVGLLFTKADAAGMTALAARFDKERLAGRSDLMPLPYAAKGTAAEDFGARQRAAWVISVLTDAPVVVYAVSGWADGRTVAEPQSAEAAMESGATGPVAQAGLGHEAQGLADRVERGLRGHVRTATERPS
ncbi:hypothetical protein [Streptomyces sp. NPDC012589]|uniref:hypothetical protein n=2 Tax=unclassified Streptomyces TaxID=2593676 RepID=UPI0036C1B61A